MNKPIFKPEHQKTSIVKSLEKPCEANATTIVISVNDRSKWDITKRFEELQID
jgi:hypothetical protein